MRIMKTFIRFAAICALLSAITTLGVHLIPGSEVATNFDERIALHTNKLYLARLWIVLFHIIIVLSSLWGVAILNWRRAPGWIGLGFVGYLLFALAELFRTSLVLFALNRDWRSTFTHATGDSATQNILQPLLAGWPGVNDALFFLLVVGFLLGNLFYGISFVSSPRRFDRLIGIMLLLWAGLGCLTVLQQYADVRSLPPTPDWIAWTYQPLVRVVLGLWLWNAVPVDETAINIVIE
ncbi:MAG: hypothetical protein DMF03_10110 [Verrucomicrobia bacterium]|nr:MAG: hypothetical protein DMF03_10110 [Verrucomicrobiota bacterium]